MQLELARKINERGCIKGGTKEACVIIEDVLMNNVHVGTQLDIYKSSASMEEFLQSLKVLVAFANENIDTEIDRFCCDSDCTYNYYRSQCPGRKNNLVICKDAKKMCPYYAVEDK